MSTNRSNLVIDINKKVNASNSSSYSFVKETSKRNAKGIKSYMGSQIVEKNKTPGPGDYENETLKIKRQNPNSTISKPLRKKLLEVEDSLSGPGKYKMNKNIKTASTVSAKQEKIINASHILPGPGDYEYNKTHKFSFAKSQRSLSLLSYEMTPSPIGPGHYEVEAGLSHIMNKSSSVTINKSQRFKTIPKTPGPGDYDYDPIKIKRRNPKYSITKQARKDLWEDIDKSPGPGDYKLKPLFGNKNNVNMYLKYFS